MNVIKFHGAMRPDAKNKPTGLNPIRRQSVIHLSNSLRDRFLRMLWAIFASTK